MKTFMTLIKTQLNVNFGISALKHRFTKEKKKRWEPFAIGLGILFGVGSLIVMYSLLMFSMFMAGSTMGQPEIVLTVSFVLGQVFVLVFGIFYIMSSFYFSKDLNVMIPLPLKPYQVLGSKFVVVMVNEYLTLLPILVPSIAICGVGTGQGLVYWVKGLLLILASPAIPLIIDSVFIMILMRFVNLRRSKDLLAIVGGLLGIVVALGVNLFFQRIPGGNEQEFFNNILRGQADLIEQIGSKFPPSIWATYGLAKPGGEGFMYFLLFIGVSIALFFVLMWLGNVIFYKALIAGQEVARRRKVLSGTEAEKEYGKTAGPLRAVFLKEWKLLFRTPVYVLNGLVGSIIGPFILVFMLISGNYSGEANEIFELIQKPEHSIFVTLGGLAFMIFTSGMNMVPPTAVSREGQTFWVSKMIPVSPRQQVLGKLIHSLVISGMGVVVTGIVLAVFFKFSIIKVLMLLILGMLASVFLSSLGLIIDVIHPKLDWNTPQQAMKQNVNGLLGMLSTLVVMVLLAVLALILIGINSPAWVVYLSLGVVLAVMAAVSTRVLFFAAERRYSTLEI